MPRIGNDVTRPIKLGIDGCGKKKRRKKRKQDFGVIPPVSPSHAVSTTIDMMVAKEAVPVEEEGRPSPQESENVEF